MSKGDKQRPMFIPRDKFEQEWDRIFDRRELNCGHYQDGECTFPHDKKEKCIGWRKCDKVVWRI